MRPARRITAYASAVVATLVLVGCGGDDSGEPDEPTTPDTTSQTSGDDSPGAGEADQTRAECVGDGEGSVTLASDEPVDLPGGSTATMASADMTNDPPTMTLDLGQATKIEQENATDLRVGDQFGVARSVYVVVRICADEAMIDEF